VISGKKYTTQSIKSFQLLPSACERKWDIYFQKSPNTNSLSKHGNNGFYLQILFFRAFRVFRG